MKAFKMILCKILPGVLAVLLLFLPLFTLANPNVSVFETKTIFGFNFALGYHIGSGAERSQVFNSSTSYIFYIFAILAIYIFEKALKDDLSKSIINAILATLVLVFYIIFQFNNYTLLTDTYMGFLYFIPTAWYYILEGLLSAYLIASITMMVLTIKSYHYELVVSSTNK